MPAKRCTKESSAEMPPVQSCEAETDGTGKGQGEEAAGDSSPIGSALEGKSKERKWSRNGLGLLASGNARESPVAPHRRLDTAGLSMVGGSLMGSRSAHSFLSCQLRKYQEGAHTCGEWGQGDSWSSFSGDGDHLLPLLTLSGICCLSQDKLLAQRRANAHPKGFQSHQPSATEAPGSRNAQSSG